SVHYFFGLGERDVEPFGQARGAHSVSQPVVHHFGYRTVLDAQLFRIDPEDASGRGTVDVFILTEYLEQNRILGEMRHDAQLDLGVIRGQEQMRRLRNKGSSDLLAELGPYWNVHQVGIDARQPARRRHGLVVSGVQSTLAGIYQGGQGIDVSVLELRQLAVL